MFGASSILNTNYWALRNSQGEVTKLKIIKNTRLLIFLCFQILYNNKSELYYTYDTIYTMKNFMFLNAVFCVIVMYCHWKRLLWTVYNNVSLHTNVAAPRPEVVVQISPQHLRIRAGAEAVFTCTVSGLPGARVTWVRQMVSRGFFYMGQTDGQ